MMADLEKQAEGEAAASEEEERFLEGMAVLDFDMLCSTVALQTQWGWRKLDGGDDENGESGDSGGVLRMWEGEVLNCFEDRRIAIESSWLFLSLFLFIFNYSPYAFLLFFFTFVFSSSKRLLFEMYRTIIFRISILCRGKAIKFWLSRDGRLLGTRYAVLVLIYLCLQKICPLFFIKNSVLRFIFHFYFWVILGKMKGCLVSF